MAKKFDPQDRTIVVLDLDGKKTDRTAELPGVLFDVPLNIPLIHQVVEAQLAAGRAGTHATKTRGMVSGGGKKPWRQKGTGRARQGSTRAPQWRGGGVVHGPQPRDYSQRTPKKMIAGALRSALSDRARCEAIIVMEDLVAEDTPSTKDAIATLAKVTDGGSTLIVVDRFEDGAQTVVKSYNNIPKVHTLWADQLNTYDVVNADQVLFTEDALSAYVDRAIQTVNHVSKETKDQAKADAEDLPKAEKAAPAKKAEKKARAEKAPKADKTADKKPAKKVKKADGAADGTDVSAKKAAKKADRKKAASKSAKEGTK